MAREFPTSASQDRMIRLFSLTCDGTTDHAKAVLSAAGLPGNGIPSGLSPAAARKLTDDALVAMFPSASTEGAVEAGTAATDAAKAERNRRDDEYRAREKAARDAETARIRAWRDGETLDRQDEEDADREAVARIGYSDADSDSRYDDR